MATHQTPCEKNKFSDQQFYIFEKSKVVDQTLFDFHLHR